MIWSIRHFTVVEEAPEQAAADAREDADDERPAEGRHEEAGEGRDEHLPLDADVDHARALADDADEREHEQDGVAAADVHARRDVVVGVVEDVGGDEHDGRDDEVVRFLAIQASCPVPQLVDAAVTLAGPAAEDPLAEDRDRDHEQDDGEQEVDDLGRDAGGELRSGRTGAQDARRAGPRGSSRAVGPGERRDGAVEAEGAARQARTRRGSLRLEGPGEPGGPPMTIESVTIRPIGMPA